MNLLRTLLIVICLPMLSCGDNSEDSVPSASSETERRVRDSLSVLYANYDSLHLWRALEQARWLQTYVETYEESIAPVVRVEVYQQLALLHYDSRLTTDSIAYFTAAAETLLPPPNAREMLPVAVRARQALCQARSAYYEWSWLKVDMFAAQGLVLLAPHKVRHPVLYAALLSIQGVARKQQGLTLQIKEERNRVWHKGMDALIAAYEWLAARNSKWRFIVLEEIKFFSARLDPQLLAHYRLRLPMLDTPQYLSGYVDEDRFRGYRHLLAGASDSTIYFYERVRERRPFFRTVNIEEGLFARRQEYLRQGEFNAALRVNGEMFVHLNCCPDSTANPLGCNRLVDCSITMSEAAEILLRRYRAEGAAADLTLAYRLSQQALVRYREALSTVNEEATFNRLDNLGERLIDRALTASWLMLARRPGDTGLQDTLLRAMEIGKAHLLSSELWVTNQPDYDRDRTEREERINELKNQYSVGYRVPTQLLDEFVQLSYLLWRDREDTPDAGYQPVNISTATVREALGPGNAFLEFAEMGDSTLAVYVDGDTSIAYCLRADTSDLARMIDSFTLMLHQPAPGTSRKLYEILLGPIGRQLAGNTQLLIVPSINLAELPFAALQEPDSSGGYLVDHLSLRYLESWRVRQYTATDRSIVGSAPPRVGVWTYPGLENYFEPLNRALLDPESGAAVTFYRGSDATAETYLRQAGHFDWLQLSVHARGNSLQLHDNYFYLNPQDSLSGRRIGRQHLRASLVVLAACSGSTGFRNRREGTLSLRRSFKRAGVPYVVASLYDIPAAASAIILADFYRGVIEFGLPPEEALARAQRRCSSGTFGQRWKRPYAWAGLVVS